MDLWVSSGLPQGQAFWVQQTWLWHKPSWRRSPLIPSLSCQNLHSTWKQTLVGHRQNLVCTRTQEKRAVSPQDTDPDLPRNVQESPAEAWVMVACCRVGVTECSSTFMGSFEEGHHYLHYLHHSLASGERTGREHSPAHQQKIGLKIY